MEDNKTNQQNGDLVISALEDLMKELDQAYREKGAWTEVVKEIKISALYSSLHKIIEMYKLQLQLNEVRSKFCKELKQI